MMTLKHLVAWTAAAAVLTVATPVAMGYSFDDVLVESWTGEGNNEAICVVDFGANSYAFGYRWNGSATSEQMLKALDTDGDGGGLDVQYHEDPDWGFAMDGFSYAGASIVGDPGWDPRFLGFWWSGNAAWTDLGENAHPAKPGDGETWESAGLGASARELGDGFFDGWSQEYVAEGYTPLNTPTTPTPEPGTLAVLGLGALAVVRRRRN